MHELRQTFLLNPVTALAFSPTEFPYPLVLAGEGSRLKVFRHDDKENLEYDSVVLSGESIHGICCMQESFAGHARPDPSPSLRCLVWGRRSFVILNLSIKNNDSDLGIELRFVTKVITLSDWILDGAFSPQSSWTDGFDAPFVQAVLVSAHNELVSIQLSRVFVSDSIFTVSNHICALGPASILYCAKCIWQPDGEIIVAAGSMFGEILIWKHQSSESLLYGPVKGVLTQSLRGHEGSVFGVHILIVDSEDRSNRKYLLASCSDDRTIRIWNIEDSFTNTSNTLRPVLQSKTTGFGEISREASQTCIAYAMGHFSRIWSVRAVSTSDKDIYLISFGEDSTALVWHLLDSPIKGARNESERLQLVKSITSHTGRNLWSSEVQKRPDKSIAMITGGADGGVVSNIAIRNVSSQQWSCSFQNLELMDKEILPKNTDSRMSAKSIFNAMKGEWILRRDIISAISTYPSGRFDGIATLVERPPTDSDYDQELLYSERGKFSTTTGFTFEGSRRYVYRYQESSNRITAWFVKLGQEADVDYLFHQVTFDSHALPREDSNDSAVASGYHLCVRDDYNAEYAFPFKNNHLESWSLKYIVKGPNKDYTASAEYEKSKPDPKEDSIEVKEPIIDIAERKLSLKSYCWLTPRTLLATTSSRYLLVGTETTCDYMEPQMQHFLSIEWTIAGYNEDFQPQSMVSRLSNDAALISGESGALWIYQNQSKSIHKLMNFSSRIVGIFPFEADGVECSSGCLITCFASKIATAIFLTTNQNEKAPEVVRQLQLELPQGPSVKSVLYLEKEKLLFVGLRPGIICIYDVSNERDTTISYQPCSTFEKVHNKDSITSIQLLPKDPGYSSQLHILTTGRDGQVAIREVQISRLPETQIHLKLIYSTNTAIGSWLEGSLLDPISHDILVWGFRSKEFIVWNVSQQREVLSVDCAGGHRSFAFIPTADGKDGGSLVWTKAGTCHAFIQSSCETKILQAGSHGREVKCIASKELGDGRMLVATGSEDTHVRLSVYDMVDGEERDAGLKTVAVLQDHTTGVLQVEWSIDGEYLFTAAGKEEFFAWRVHKVPCIELGVVLEARCPAVTETSSDLRITDFTLIPLASNKTWIGMVYSDSTIRLWSYERENHTNPFVLRSVGTFGTNCLTQISMWYLTNSPYFITASTDGSLALWPLQDKFDETNNQESILDVEFVCHVHQNSIKTIAVFAVSSHSIIIATGGDDNAIGFTMISNTANGNSVLPICTARVMIPKAHAASITAVQWIESETENDEKPKRKHLKLLSASNDQLLKTWDVFIKSDETVNKEEMITVREGRKRQSEVADVACLEVMRSVRGRKERLILAGVGFETWINEWAQ